MRKISPPSGNTMVSDKESGHLGWCRAIPALEFLRNIRDVTVVGYDFDSGVLMRSEPLEHFERGQFDLGFGVLPAQPVAFEHVDV